MSWVGRAHVVVAFAVAAVVAGGIGGLGACERGLGHESVCGDGVVESSETCDGDCPETCDDGNACTAGVMSGSPATCDVRCAHDPIVACQSGDGCCPGSCNALEDDDCPSVCGNGVVEPSEMCDGDCPEDCDDQNACTVDERSGGPETCDVLCSHDPIMVCTSGDGCCPDGGQGDCHALNDGDCDPFCGNGVLESPEECDDGSTVGGDGCGTTCLFEVCGNGILDVGEACDDSNTTDGDGCSADCLSDESCGNGVVEPPETCEGDCSEDCDDLDACTVDERSGGPETCDVLCAHEAIVTCVSGDLCCPGGGQGDCHAVNDADLHHRWFRRRADGPLRPTWLWFPSKRS